jgi:hypothetical protein
VTTQFAAEVMERLEHLCVEIGPRPMGSTGNQAAADYIATVFEANRLDVEIQELNCPIPSARPLMDVTLFPSV